MVCNQTKGKATLCHDILAPAWRRAIRRAGCAFSAEPAYSSIAQRHSGDPGLCRGDILALMPGGRIAVLDCVVTHPIAPSYLACASQTAGYAAERMERKKRSEFERFGSAVHAMTLCRWPWSPMGTWGERRLASFLIWATLQRRTGDCVRQRLCGV